MEHELERIAKHRDRFAAWSLVLGFISFTIAVWTTAPSLEVKLPLIAGTEVGINLGYILSIGILVLTFAVGLTYSSLFSMRDYQLAAVARAKRENHSFSEAELLTVVGPYSAESVGRAGTLNLGQKLSSGSRIFLYFILPVLAEVFVLIGYNDLAVFDISTTNSENKGHPVEQWNIHANRELGIFTEWEMSKGEYAYVRDSTLEKNCSTEFSNEKNREKYKCVYLSYPKFMPILNTVVNLVFFFILFTLVIVGHRVYKSSDIKQLILNGNET